MAPRLEELPAVEELPDGFKQDTTTPRTTSGYWWRGFRDSGLEQLVDSALAGNQDLRVAIARVDELRSQYRIARAQQLPLLDAGIQRDVQSTPSNTGIGGALRGNAGPSGESNFPDRFDYTVYRASLGFSYELDFWGRVRGSKNAAVQELFATEADARIVLMGVISETIAAYFEITERQHTLALTKESVRLLRERLELTGERYERGLVFSHERYRIQQEFEEARATLPGLESQLEEANSRLRLVLGRYTMPLDTVVFRGEAPHFAMEPIPAGLPSSLLETRPDIVAAFHRLEAARQRVGVARADRFPRLALTASAGIQSNALSDLVKTSQNFWLFGSGLTAPIFSAGTIKANIRASWARYEQQAALYEKTVMTAFKEVSLALVAHDKQRERYLFLVEAQATAHANAEAQERRYVRGIGDYLGLLDARRNLVRTEMASVAAFRATADARLGVHRALGGAWLTEAAMDF